MISYTKGRHKDRSGGSIIKKIPAQARANDRITIENVDGVMHFCYEKAGRGRTIRELYRFRDWGDPRLAKTIERISSAVAYVAREESGY